MRENVNTIQLRQRRAAHCLIISHKKNTGSIALRGLFRIYAGILPEPTQNVHRT